MIRFLFFIGVIALSMLSITANASNYCFIGDSRFVGMRQTVSTDENIIWMAEIGADQSWYWTNRGSITDLDRSTIIVYELGVNDLDSTRCLEALNDLQELGFTLIYFTSVTPVDEYMISKYGYTRTNSEIEKFNEEVRNDLPSNVDTMYCYEYLVQSGIETEDGLHYESRTYHDWFNNIMNIQPPGGEAPRLKENSSGISKFATVVPARISRFPCSQAYSIDRTNKVFLWIPMEYFPRGRMA